jgi:hypothetical protein
MGLDTKALALGMISIQTVLEQATYSLPWPNPGTFDDFDTLNSCTCNGQVFIRTCNCINHCDLEMYARNDMHVDSKES